MAEVMAECISESVAAVTRAAKRGGIQFVVGMEHQSYIKSLGGRGRRLLAASASNRKLAA